MGHQELGHDTAVLVINNMNTTTIVGSDDQTGVFRAVDIRKTDRIEIAGDLRFE